MSFPTPNINREVGTVDTLLDGLDTHFADASQHSPVVNVASYGAVNNGAGDQGPAINAAIAAANTAFPDGASVFVPAGWYRITTPIVPKSNVMVFGEGPGSIFYWVGSGICVTLDNTVLGTSWRDLRFIGDSAFSSYILVDMNLTFMNTFTNVWFQGHHDPTGTARPNQQGVRIRGNCGDNFWNSCRWVRMGTPIECQWAVGNNVNQCHFSECYYGVIGTANVVASLVITNCTFASTAGSVSQSPFHIDIQGSAGEWYIDNCWFEGALKTMIVGRSGVGGPSGFGLTNTHLASSTTNLEMQSCRQPYIANCVFSNNGVGSPTHISIDAGSTANGVAINLVPHTGATEIPLSVFPTPWFVVSRTSYRFPS